MAARQRSGTFRIRRSSPQLHRHRLKSSLPRCHTPIHTSIPIMTAAAHRYQSYTAWGQSTGLSFTLPPLLGMVTCCHRLFQMVVSHLQPAVSKPVASRILRFKASRILRFKASRILRFEAWRILRFKVVYFKV